MSKNIFIALLCLLAVAGCCSTCGKNTSQAKLEPDPSCPAPSQTAYNTSSSYGSDYSYSGKSSSSDDETSFASNRETPAAAVPAKLTSRQIQTALKSAGYYNGSIDGKVGPKTKDAIVKFQKDHNLKADGIVGKKTIAELAKYIS